MKDLGYDTYSNTYEDLVGQLLNELSELRRLNMETEKHRFQKEIKRLLKPTN